MNPERLTTRIMVVAGYLLSDLVQDTPVSAVVECITIGFGISEPRSLIF